ncbi:hypothetical protein CRM22_006049 [Opisthorchis felineus]|uniref:C2H2-type domain-containing protein n=1 Tax=Opisthorchis felineus TaxID=147828 RepID=A0A4S2LMZ5_OPIFE|nr:hypothetical protein CRM22_006049 [Opisthorchis felineus]
MVHAKQEMPITFADGNADEHLSLEQYTDNQECFAKVSNVQKSRAPKKHALTHTPGFNHVCDYCGRFYRVPFQLMQHIRTHTGERPYVYNCCNAKFSTKGALQKHVKRRHERRLRCRGQNLTSP